MAHDFVLHPTWLGICIPCARCHFGDGGVLCSRANALKLTPCLRGKYNKPCSSKIHCESPTSCNTCRFLFCGFCLRSYLSLLWLMAIPYFLEAVIEARIRKSTYRFLNPREHKLNPRRPHGSPACNVLEFR
jgi:hypothetical protein